MPVGFEEYYPEGKSLRLEEGSNAYGMLSFLLENRTRVTEIHPSGCRVAVSERLSRASGKTA